jgi:hypothetical protein
MVRQPIVEARYRNRFKILPWLKCAMRLRQAGDVAECGDARGGIGGLKFIGSPA